MDAAPEDLRNPEGITHQILAIHFASIHTTSSVSHIFTHNNTCTVIDALLQTLTHTLYQIASMPEYIAPLREEIEQVSERIGWTKEGIDSMHKVDSFMRESQRVNGIGTSTCAFIFVAIFSVLILFSSHDAS